MLMGFGTYWLGEGPMFTGQPAAELLSGYRWLVCLWLVLAALLRWRIVLQNQRR